MSPILTDTTGVKTEPPLSDGALAGIIIAAIIVLLIAVVVTIIITIMCVIRIRRR